MLISSELPTRDKTTSLIRTHQLSNEMPTLPDFQLTLALHTKTFFYDLEIIW